jgi:predicted HicB family RNase H-like nuclease
LPEDEKKQFVTSLRVDSELWKEAKVQAIRHDISLTELVEEALNLWIQEKMVENEKTKKSM